MNAMRSKVRCHRPWTGFELFDHTGDVRPCCWGKLSCGNVNHASPAQLWNGPGYAFYRDRMLKGDLDAICRPECPIRLGSYEEVTGNGRIETAHASGVAAGEPPVWLRVVPSTKCNLSCPMCYQHDAEPTTLPPNLMAQLSPWLNHAAELLVLGGETFVAKACLDWIEFCSPERFPDLKLSAITNAYGFGERAMTLLRERRWAWILASIDAAGDTAYKKIRGGDFQVVLAGLDALARARTTSIEPFELRLGFTIQQDNLDDALRFLDVCDDFSAVPQYTLVFGDWHQQNVRDEARLIATLEALDKELLARGFGSGPLLSVLGRGLRRSRKREVDSKAAVVHIEASQSVRAGVDAATRVRGGARVAYFGATTSGLTALAETISGRNGARLDCFDVPEVDATVVSTQDVLWITVGNDLEGTTKALTKVLDQAPPKQAIIRLPYWREGRAVSALDYRAHVETIKRILAEHGVNELTGCAAAVELGLDPEEQAPAVRWHDERCSGSAKVALISPVYGQRDLLGSFLASIAAQRVEFPFEVVLVDDGHPDFNGEAITSVVREFRDLQYRVLSLDRSVPYVPGTFTFRAGVARQAGVQATTAPVLLFVDPDQTLQPGCLAEHLHWQERGFDVVLGDRTQSELPGTAAYSSAVLQWQSTRLRALHGSTWWTSFYTGNVAVSRDAFDRAGGFDPSLQYWGLDDTDLGYRLFKTGARLWHTPRAGVIHGPTPSGGGVSRNEQMRSFRLHMEVLYRKYLDESILDAHRFAWELR